jgi:hypothetical protein
MPRKKSGSVAKNKKPFKLSSLKFGQNNPEKGLFTKPDPRLPLALLVASIRANDVHDPAAANHLAVLANLLNGRTDFHDSRSSMGEGAAP